MRIINGKGEKTLILAHGAGAGMDSDFLNCFAEGIAEENINVIRFNFPYMTLIKETGKRRPPNSTKILMASYLEEINLVQGPLFIGGKSMGGRIATMLADNSKATGVVCFGYPFHPPGKPEKLRTAHLEEIKTPTLILQGERDPFGKRIEVESYPLSKNISVKWLHDGDHSLKPRKVSGRSQSDNWTEAIQRAVEFINAHPME